jgi:hypothetical protein
MSLAVWGFAAEQHRDGLFDAPGACARPFRLLDPAEDGVMIATSASTSSTN